MNAARGLFIAGAGSALVAACALWTSSTVPSRTLPAVESEAGRIADTKLAAAHLLDSLDVLEASIVTGLPKMEAGGDRELVELAREADAMIDPMRKAAKELLAGGWREDPQLMRRIEHLNAEFQQKNDQFQRAYARYLSSLPSHLGPGAPIGRNSTRAPEPRSGGETLVARLARKFRTTEYDITAKTLKTQELLADKGVRMTSLQVMAGLDSAVDAENSLGVRYEEVAAMFVSLCAAQ